MKLAVTRRALLAGVAAGTALSSARLTAASGEATAQAVIVQHGLAPHLEQAIAARHTGARMVELQRDVVRHWRAALGDQVNTAGTAKAYVPWAQANILAGLAREAGGKSRLAAFTPNLFEVWLSIPPSGTAGAA